MLFFFTSLFLVTRLAFSYHFSVLFSIVFESLISHPSLGLCAFVLSVSIPLVLPCLVLQRHSRLITPPPPTLSLPPPPLFPPHPHPPLPLIRTSPFSFLLILLSFFSQLSSFSFILDVLVPIRQQSSPCPSSSFLRSPSFPFSLPSLKFLAYSQTFRGRCWRWCPLPACVPGQHWSKLYPASSRRS